MGFDIYINGNYFDTLFYSGFHERSWVRKQFEKANNIKRGLVHVKFEGEK